MYFIRSGEVAIKKRVPTARSWWRRWRRATSSARLAVLERIRCTAAPRCGRRRPHRHRQATCSPTWGLKEHPEIAVRMLRKYIAPTAGDVVADRGAVSEGPGPWPPRRPPGRRWRRRRREPPKPAARSRPRRSPTSSRRRAGRVPVFSPTRSSDATTRDRPDARVDLTHEERRATSRGGTPASWSRRGSFRGRGDRTMTDLPQSGSGWRPGVLTPSRTATS